MKRKIISLAMMLCLLSSTVVSAGEFDSSALVDNTAQVKVPVTATITSTFTVSLPASLELTADGSQYTYSSTVGVKGDTNIESAVTVVPEENIVVYDVTNRPEGLTETPTAESEQESYEHKVPQPVTISQEKTSWAYTDLAANVDAFVETPITASARLTSGKWEGILRFVIDYSSTYNYNLTAGLYDSSGNMLASWEEAGIDVTKSYSRVNDAKNTLESVYWKTNKTYPGTTTVVIPDGVESLGQYSFAGCSNLMNIILPDSLKEISYGAFQQCAGLKSMTIPDSVTRIGVGMFDSCDNLTSLTIGNGVTSIVEYSFQGCTGLTSVTIGNGVTSIGTNAFYNCTGLTSVTIGNNVTSIGQSAFCGCTGLTSITIPDSVTSIDNAAFSNCTGLTSVTIGNSVTSLSTFVFDGCTSLTSATFNTTTGWYTGSSSGAKNTAISSSDLSDISTAATYLKSTYLTKYWTRE